MENAWIGHMITWTDEDIAAAVSQAYGLGFNDGRAPEVRLGEEWHARQAEVLATALRNAAMSRSLRYADELRYDDAALMASAGARDAKV